MARRKPARFAHATPGGLSQEGTLMIRTALAIVCLCCAAVASAGAYPLSMFPTELIPLDPGGVLETVDVYVAGKEPYDTYFLEVARVQGTLAIADALTRQFGQALAAATGAAVDSGSDQWPELLKKLADKPGKPDEMAALQLCGQRLERLVDPLTSAGEKLPGLAAQLPGLMTSAPQDFTGLRGRLKLVGVMNALRKSGGQLEHAALDTKRVLDNVSAIVAVVPR
jgi:hypothetical protein